MTVWIFSIPVILIVVVFIAAYAVADFAYNSFADYAQSVIDILPTVEIVFVIVVAIISVILAIKKKQILHGIVMFLSWSKSIFFMGIGLEAFLEGIVATEGVLMTIFVLPILFVVCICIPGAELALTVKAWSSEDEDDHIQLALIEFGVVAIIIFILWLIS